MAAVTFSNIAGEKQTGEFELRGRAKDHRFSTWYRLVQSARGSPVRSIVASPIQTCQRGHRQTHQPAMRMATAIFAMGYDMKAVIDLMARRAVLGSICVMDALLFFTLIVPKT